jgi:plasmid maintenance system antidote protein VapI
MSDIDNEVKQVLRELIGFIVSSGTNFKERKALARRAGVNDETVRKILERQSLSADTLLRLLLAKGVSAQTLMHLSQLSQPEKLLPGEKEWIQFGRECSDAEKREYTALLRFLKSKWKLV